MGDTLSDLLKTNIFVQTKLCRCPAASHPEQKDAQDAIPNSAVELEGKLTGGLSQPRPYKGLVMTKACSGENVGLGPTEIFGSGADLVWASAAQQLSQHTAEGHRIWTQVEKKNEQQN